MIKDIARMLVFVIQAFATVAVLYFGSLLFWAVFSK
jgi:hypothetical protein